jgi:Tfp pilus assembly protein PilX
MLLALLTIISVAAIDTANTEVTVAGNEYVYQRNFYMAEGAALEAVDRLRNDSNLGEQFPHWVENTGALSDENLDEYLQNSAEDGDSVYPAASAVNAGHARFITRYLGPEVGESLDATRTQVHAFEIYGHCAWDGASTIKLGYLQAF